MTKLKIRRRPFRGYIQEAKKARRALVEHLVDEFDYTVQAGPLTGLKLIAGRSWGNDMAAQLLGLYEQQLTAPLTATQGGTFIDIGAADGIWAVGLVQAGHFDRAICFEARKGGQDRIAQLAELNGVADRIEIHGLAEDGFTDTLGDLSDTFVLIDIEGAEFDLLTDEVLKSLSSCQILVEVHIPNDETKAMSDALIDRALPYFTLETLDDSIRDATELLDRVELPDFMRYLILCEERGHVQKWLHFTPKS